MYCPVCNKEYTTSFFRHCFDYIDIMHLVLLKEIVAIVDTKARSHYAFSIAEYIVSKPNFYFLNKDIAELTAFCSYMIVALGYNRRRRVGAERIRETKYIITTKEIQEGCTQALVHKERKTIPKIVEIPTVCSCCNTQKDPFKITAYSVDPTSPNSLLSNTSYVCYDCIHELRALPAISITKIFTFAAAHHLPGHPRLCQYTHGHEWQLEVTIKAVVHPKTRMVIDFSDLKKYVKREIIDVLDHNYVNDLLWNPTAENMCTWIWDKLMYSGLKGIEKIKLWEAPESFAVLTKDEYDV